MAWEQISKDLRPWYRNEIVVGHLTVCMDVWPADVKCAEWVWALQGRNAEPNVYKPKEMAMKAAENSMCSRLRQSIRAIKSASRNGHC